MVPILLDCWGDNIILNYDPITRHTTNNPGVEVRVPGWGDPTVVEFLDPSQQIFSITFYFNAFVEALIRVGYERKKTIRAAPYDFRKGPNELQKWFEDLKVLVEESFNYNGERVTLLCHSMGCKMTLVFLHMQTQDWTYVREGLYNTRCTMGWKYESTQNFCLRR